MCKQMYREYTCGCKKEGEFIQCAARRGTGVKCDPVEKVELEAAIHMCSDHMVKPGKDEMRR